MGLRCGPESDPDSPLCMPFLSPQCTLRSPFPSSHAATGPIEPASKRRNSSSRSFYIPNFPNEAILQMIFLKKDLPSLARIALLVSIAALIGSSCGAQQSAPKTAADVLVLSDG